MTPKQKKLFDKLNAEWAKHSTTAARLQKQMNKIRASCRHENTYSYENSTDAGDICEDCGHSTSERSGTARYRQ